MSIHRGNRLHGRTSSGPWTGGALVALAFLISFLPSAEAGWRPGLMVGKVSGMGEIVTDVFPSETNTTLTIPHATSGATWGPSTMWVYWGQIYLDGSTYRFGESIDDMTYLAIDGEVVLQDRAWNVPTFGTIKRPAGWYSFDLRFQNGGGGAGPVGGKGGGFSAEKGFCYTKGAENVGGLEDATSFVIPGDPGDGTLFHYDDGLGFEDSLAIVSSPHPIGEPTPSYGSACGLQEGDSFTCSAPEFVTHGTFAWGLVGYALYDVDSYTGARTNLVSSGAGPSFTYTHAGHARELEWRWKIDSYLVSITAGAGGTVSTTGGYHKVGASVEVEAVAGEGKRFTYWSGDVDSSQLHDPVITLEVNRALTLMAHFGSVLHVSDAIGDDAADGQSWETSMKTIGAALARAGEGDIVLVTNGLYRISSELTIEKGVFLAGVEGREETRIQGSGCRILYLDAPHAIVDGFTLSGGVAGSTSPGGGFAIGRNGGTVRRCRVTGSSASWGGFKGISVHMQGGLASSCLIDGNRSNHGQSGTVFLQGGLMENCVIRDNRMHNYGAGLWMEGGVARNCTITRNTSAEVGNGVYREKNALLENCIVWGNVNSNDPNSPDREIFGATPAMVFHCCYPGDRGTGTVTNAPQFIDPEKGDFRLRAGSPCIDAGRPVASLPKEDHAGARRVVGASVDIGAFERDTDEFSCGFRAQVRQGPEPLDVVLVPAVHGAVSSSGTLETKWTIESAGGPSVSSSTTGVERFSISLPAGVYAVTLEVTDPATGESAREWIPDYLVSSPRRIHVVSANTNAVAPYDTWEHAATDLGKAFMLASEGTTVLLSNGLYRIHEPLIFDQDVKLEGVNGRDETIIEPDSGHRICLLDHPSACVMGVTLRGAHIGRGIRGSVLITEKGGLLDRCRVSSNISSSYDSNGAGVRMNGGRVNRCIIDGNALNIDSMIGSGVYQSGGILENSLIISNRTYSLTQNSGGGVAMAGPGVIRNCTIVGNSAAYGGGIYLNGWGARSAVVQNCILFGNVTGQDTSAGAPNWNNNCGGDLEQICSANCTPVPFGRDCLTAVPGFCDPESGDFSLKGGSPCIDAGILFEGLSETDLGGNPRLTGNGLDIGAYEYDARAPSCGISVTPSKAITPATVTFSATAFGFGDRPEDLNYTWVFDDDKGGPIQSDRGLVSVSHRYDSPGKYQVRLEVSDPADGSRKATTVLTNAVLVSPVFLYVASNNVHCAEPYDCWERAATNIVDALSWASDGCTIIVGDGVYDLPKAVHLDRAIRLQSVNGYRTTILKGRKTRGVRVVELHHPGAVVEGFTICGGCVPFIGFGGGVNIEKGTLARCLVADNEQCGYSNGGGINMIGGLVTECVISNTVKVGSGGGINLQGGICEKSLITAGLASSGGGVYQKGGVLRDCVISRCSADSGGGLWLVKGEVRNCTITGNNETDAGKLGAGGLHYGGHGTVVNCIIWGNTAAGATGPGSPDWAYEGDITGAFGNNCTPIPIGTDCVVADPLFRAPEKGDYRIRSGSPCRDAGLYEEWMAGATDFWGNPRVDVRRRVDIGAHEETSSHATMLILR